MLFLKNYPGILKVFNSVLICIGVLYPFALFFLPSNPFLFIAMAVVCVLRYLCAKSSYEKIIWILLTIIFLLHFLLDTKMFAYLYPVFINILLCCAFLLSLKGEALITKIAKKSAMLKGEVLNPYAVIYTRNLTKIWCVFFALNACVTLLLIFLEDKIFWMLYCGIISYILVGVLFCGELVYRKLILGL